MSGDSFCPRGHRLEERDLDNRHCDMDGCNNNSNDDCTFLHCGRCDYDVCMECAEEMESEESGCLVYQHANFTGWEAIFPPGKFNQQECAARGMKNDDMSSIRVLEGFCVTLFQHGNFKGWKTSPRIGCGDWTLSELKESFGLKNDDASSLICRRDEEESSDDSSSSSSSDDDDDDEVTTTTTTVTITTTTTNGSDSD